MQPFLARWSNFYEILGTAAASLVGLQFIAVTLIATVNRTSTTMREMHAFGTPNIVLFSMTLCTAAIMSAPWQSASHLGICILFLGLLGVWNSASSIYHARKSAYNPDVEDWIWYAGVPMCAHACMILFGGCLIADWNWAVVGVAAVSLACLFIGIHNAWDTVTFIVTRPVDQNNSLTRGE